MRRSSLVPTLALTAVLLALLVVPTLAQTLPPAPTAVLTPTVVPTPTRTDPIQVMSTPTTAGFVALFLENGLWLCLGVLLLVGVVTALVAIFIKNIEALGVQLNVVAHFFRWLKVQRTLGPDQQAYLKWLINEHGRLPQIGIATEQVVLDVESVHVPLRVIERNDALAYQSKMRGEMSEGGDTSSRPPQTSLFGQGDEDVRIFTLLSDARALHRQIHARQQSTLGWAERLQGLIGRGKQRDQIDLATIEQAVTRQLLLLGDAGSGKTTTLRYAALRCADAYLRASPRLLAESGLGLVVRRAPFPIYVRLTLFATTLPDDLEALAPAERQRYTGAPPQLFLDWLDVESQKFCRVAPGTLSRLLTGRGDVLLLLDGLDEAGSEHRRAYLAELISNLVIAYPSNRYVVAGRTAGYGGAVQLPAFTERHLSPLNARESRTLIERWYRAVDACMIKASRERREENAEAQTARLWGVIERNERIFEMATNPLLVTAMCLLQFNNVRLPDQRAKLYEKLVELLLDLWRKLNVTNDLLRFSVAQVGTERRRIEYLALQMQQQPRQVREISLRQAQEWLSPLYTERLKIDREDADMRVSQLFESLSIDSGLLQCRENGYSFSHYTFQEYLAARALDGLDPPAGRGDSVAFLLERAEDQRWRETLLLAAGHWSNGQQLAKTERLICTLLDADLPSRILLAAEALADIGPVEELTILRDRATVHLPAMAFNPTTMCADPALRAQAATLLDRLGADQRPALDPACPDFWAEKMTPGPFTMGPAPEVFSGQGTQESFTSRIRQPYALAHFPVTNRLYLRFLETCNEADVERHRPRLWPGRRYRSGEGAYPVVGVTWENACAFAAWANTTFLSAEQRAAGEIVRLPTEPEWERAAAYPVVVPPGQPSLGRREYPWGQWPADLTDATDESIKRNIRANTQESGLKDTTPVGIFPHGAAACTAEELAGNVWEWCATAYQKYPLPDDLEAESIYTSQNWKQRTYVLRGGSYYGNRTLARGGARYLNLPFNGDDHDGFRLARLFSSESS
ncbi:MAG: SUMF1/EgtB/PvdO family nonheme iron enzyme [Chloroflexales bacterium]